MNELPHEGPPPSSPQPPGAIRDGGSATRPTSEEAAERDLGEGDSGYNVDAYETEAYDDESTAVEDYDAEETQSDPSEAGVETNDVDEDDVDGCDADAYEVNDEGTAAESLPSLDPSLGARTRRSDEDSLLGSTAALALVLHLFLFTAASQMAGDRSKNIFDPDEQAKAETIIRLTHVAYYSKSSASASTSSASSQATSRPDLASATASSQSDASMLSAPGQAANSTSAPAEQPQANQTLPPAGSPPDRTAPGSSTKRETSGPADASQPEATSRAGRVVLERARQNGGPRRGRGRRPDQGDPSDSDRGDNSPRERGARSEVNPRGSEDSRGPGSEGPGDGQPPDKGHDPNGQGTPSAQGTPREYKVGEQVDFEPIKNGRQIAFEAIKHTEQKELVPYKNSGQKSFEGIKHGEQIAFEPINHAEQKPFEAIKHGEQIGYGTHINYDTPNGGGGGSRDGADKPDNLPPGPLQLRAYLYPVNPYTAQGSAKGYNNAENAVRVQLVLSVETDARIEFEAVRARFVNARGDIMGKDELEIAPVTRLREREAMFYYRNPLNMGDLSVEVKISYFIGEEEFGQRIRLTPDRRGYPESYNPSP